MMTVRLIGLAIGAYCLEHVLTAIMISTWVEWDFWWIGRFVANIAVGLVGIWLALELVIKRKAGTRQIVLGACVMTLLGLEKFWGSPLGFILYGEFPAFEPPLLAMAMLTARFLVVGAFVFLGINALRAKRFRPLSIGFFLLIFCSYVVFYNGFHSVACLGDIIDFFWGLRLHHLPHTFLRLYTYRMLFGFIFRGLMTIFGFCGVFIGVRLTQRRELVFEKAQPKYKDPWMWIIVALIAYGLAESSFGFVLLMDGIILSPTWLRVLGDSRELLLGVILLLIGKRLYRKLFSD